MNKALQIVCIIMLSICSIVACSGKSGENNIDTANENDLLLLEAGDIKIYDYQLQEEFIKEKKAGHGQSTVLEPADILSAILEKTLNIRLVFKEADKNNYASSGRVEFYNRLFSGQLNMAKIMAEEDSLIRSMILEGEYEDRLPEKYIWATFRQVYLHEKDVAEEVLAKAKAGADFLELVKKYSIGPNALLRDGLTERYLMGDSGLFNNPDDMRTAYDLEVGEIYDGVVESPLGYMVFIMHEKIVDDETLTKIAQDKVDSNLYAEKKAIYRRAYYDKYLKKTFFKIHQSDLKRAVEMELNGEVANDIVVAEFGELKILYSNLSVFPEKLHIKNRDNPDVRYSIMIDNINEAHIILLREDLYLRNERGKNLKELVFIDQYKRAVASSFIKKKFQEVDVTEEGMKKFYETNPNYFRTPPAVEVQALYTRTEDGAKRAIDMVKDGADFGDVVKELSVDDRTQELGGYIGWVKAGQSGLTREVEAAVIALNKGDISEPIKGKKGYIVAKALNKYEAGEIKSFDRVKDWIKKKLIKDARSKAIQEYLVKLRGANEIIYYDKNIKEALVRYDKIQSALAESSEQSSHMGTKH